MVTAQATVGRLTLGLGLLPDWALGGLPPSLAWPPPSLPHRAASGPTALFRNTKAAGAAIGGVKNMLLEWCRAMTRNYEVGKGQGPFPRRQYCQGSERVGASEGAIQALWPEAHCGSGLLAHSMWTSRTSPQAGAAAWPSAPSSTSSSPTPLTTPRWTPQNAGITSPWPSPQQSKPWPPTQSGWGSQGA